MTTPPAVATVQGNTPTVQDLGTVTFNSPSRDRRNQRRDSLVTAEALTAMRLSNEVIGDRGLGYPVDRVTRTPLMPARLRLRPRFHLVLSRLTDVR